ncbi:MAG: alpha/beta fold hydrolase [Flavisolibacter sp.]
MAYYNIRGNQFYYLEQNAHLEETILLIHGHPFDHTMWKYQHKSLQQFRLIMPDLQGYGKSSFSCESKIFIEEQALNLVLLLDGVQVDRVHLIGLSMGGQIALEFARLFPHRSQSLVLCACDPSAETSLSYEARLQQANLVEEIGMKAYTKSAIEQFLHPATLQGQPCVYQHLYQMMAGTRTAVAAASHRGRAERRDNFQFLSSLCLPVLVISGEQDIFTPMQQMQRISQRIPKARLEIIPGTGHLPNMEQAKVFNEALIRFYQSLRIHSGSPLSKDMFH